MVVDSYRAVITEPSNPRVYLMLADAWCEMGQEYDHAKEALATGRRLCKEGVEQLTNRYDELDKLQREHEEEKFVYLCLYIHTFIHAILILDSVVCVATVAC